MSDRNAEKDYQLQVEQRQDFLLVKVTGKNNAQTVMQYLQEVQQACEKHDCFRVLIDEELDGPRLDISEVYAIASDGAMNAMGVFQAIAYVDPRMGDAGEFAENVAVNRGMPVRTFATVAEAQQWLSGQSEGTAEKTLFEEHNSRNRFR